MKMIIANFKSNKNRTETEDWIGQLKANSSQLTARIVLCPPLPHLYLFDAIKSESIALGVQDISPYPAGAYTGAIGTLNLDGFDVKYAIVGHSERRTHFHETSSDVASKVRECISAGITPIVCVTKDEINTQANTLDQTERSKCIVAFEPVEHIGTGESDTLEHIIETKKWVQTAFGTVPYIYGGSVNPNTHQSILTSNAIDGFLVGSASLNAQTFFELALKAR